MAEKIRPIKGTTDYYPDQMALRSWLYGQVRQVSESFGYQEYEGPLLEPLELYAAKSGEELVQEQSFVFPDRGGNLITLRPELTPTLARLIAQRQKQLTFPLRWYSYGPMWRYEQPQRGRSREFFQWNIDLIGADSAEADAEILAVGAGYLARLGLTPEQVSIRVNNRKLMEGELRAVGVPPELLPGVIRLIDRKARMQPEDWQAYGLELGLVAAQLSDLENLLTNTQLWERSDALQRLFETLEAMGVREYIRYDPLVIRGLDYYTGTVFECFDARQKFRSIFAGGRYDSLVSDVGGEAIPAVGFAMGDKVITVVLEHFGLLPDFSTASTTDVLVTVFDGDSFEASIALAAKIRAAGWRVVMSLEPSRLAKQLKYADRIRARAAVIQGPDELLAGSVSVKVLKTREQLTFTEGDLLPALDKILAGDLSS